MPYCIRNSRREIKGVLCTFSFSFHSIKLCHKCIKYVQQLSSNLNTKTWWIYRAWVFEYGSIWMGADRSVEETFAFSVWIGACTVSYNFIISKITDELISCCHIVLLLVKTVKSMMSLSHCLVFEVGDPISIINLSQQCCNFPHRSCLQYASPLIKSFFLPSTL